MAGLLRPPGLPGKVPANDLIHAQKGLGRPRRISAPICRGRLAGLQHVGRLHSVARFRIVSVSCMVPISYGF